MKPRYLQLDNTILLRVLWLLACTWHGFWKTDYDDATKTSNGGQDSQVVGKIYHTGSESPYMTNELWTIEKYVWYRTGVGVVLCWQPSKIPLS